MKTDINMDLVFATISHLEQINPNFGHIIGYQTVTITQAIKHLQDFIRERNAYEAEIGGLRAAVTQLGGSFGEGSGAPVSG